MPCLAEGIKTYRDLGETGYNLIGATYDRAYGVFTKSANNGIDKVLIIKRENTIINV